GSAVGTPSATNPSSYSPGVVSAIAFCPSPPLLVPELAAGAAGELDPLRAACREAVRRLLAGRPDQVIVIGTGSGGGRFPPGSTGTLAGYGVPVTASLPGADLPCQGVAVDGDTPSLPDAPAYLVVGDGSARRTERAPGYVDRRAEPFDAAVAATLAAGDAAALRDLDPVLGAELLAAGVPAWRAVGRALAGRGYAADLLYDAAPYGVGYFVAVWAAP